LFKSRFVFFQDLNVIGLSRIDGKEKQPIFASMRMRKKSELPEKTCVVCQRPFTWRKKWARDWEQVKYCSQKCRYSGEAAPLKQS
jgi:hypothetical protein